MFPRRRIRSPGHGYTADTDADFHYEDMATETVRVLEQVVGAPAHLVGWSDGGIVALIIARKRPDLVHKLVVIGANYDYDRVMPVEMDPASSLVQELSKAHIERPPDSAEHLELAFSKSSRMYGTEPTPTTAAMGAARDSYEAALEYSKERLQFGKPLAGYQITQEKLVNMLLEIQKGTLPSLRGTPTTSWSTALCAERALPVFEDRRPNDERPRNTNRISSGPGMRRNSNKR